jgi:hypothetical protein
MKPNRGLGGSPSDAGHIMVFQHLHKADPLFKSPSDTVQCARRTGLKRLKTPYLLG